MCIRDKPYSVLILTLNQHTYYVTKRRIIQAFSEIYFVLVELYVVVFLGKFDCRIFGLVGLYNRSAGNIASARPAAQDVYKRQEGPKFYKHDGLYYVLSPAGGVPTGWQVALRSENVYGPYEDHIVLRQGLTEINGPHQGGLVELENGESWFIHFQDLEVIGRISHLQPVQWIDGLLYTSRCV